MKKIVLSISLALSTLVGLSGCMATRAISDKMYTSEDKILFSDTIVAIGKPKVAIPEYPNALVLAGEKNYYLVVGLDERYQNKINLIVNNLDLKDVRISHMSAPKLWSDSYYYAQVELKTNKTKEQISDAEYKIWQEVGGTYNTIAKDNKSSAGVRVDVKLIPIQKPQQQNLQHQFSKPQTLNFVTYNTKTTSKKYILPFAVALDIITMPIQLIVTPYPSMLGGGGMD